MRLNLEMEVEVLSPQQENVILSSLLGKKTGLEGAIKTGFLNLDNIFPGFRLGSTYLVAGLEKSGKTAFLLNVLSNILNRGEQVGFISTEMDLSEITHRLETIREATDDLGKKRDLRAQLSRCLSFVGKSEDSVCVENQLSLDLCIKQLREWANLYQTKLIIFDNLTTFSSRTEGKKKGWEIQADAMTKLTTLAAELQVAVLFVIHTKSTSLIVETERVTGIIKNKKPWEIFQSQVTVVQRPTLSDCYGGVAALSQISGAFLIWRPFQKFSDSFYNTRTCLILDSQRHSESGVMIEMDFDLVSGRWEEVQDDSWSQMTTNVFEGKEE